MNIDLQFYTLITKQKKGNLVYQRQQYISLCRVSTEREVSLVQTKDSDWHSIITHQLNELV